MQTRKTALSLFATLALAVPLHNARADEFAFDRFKGGTSDGFASAGIYRDASVIAALVRFLGGYGDGYVVTSLSGLQVPPRGTLISIF